MSLPVNKIICKDWIEAAKGLHSQSVHTIICSPPYWGQRLYLFGTDNPCDGKKIKHDFEDVTDYLMICKNCGGKAPKLGLEKTPEEHIENLVAGFRELRRILRDDGTLWLNYGDKYNVTQTRGTFGDQSTHGYISHGYKINNVEDLDQGNLLGLAWRLALALQADGWILRSDTIWAKALSFCDKYSGSTMPESVNGWRWERCRVKIRSALYSGKGKEAQTRGKSGRNANISDYYSKPETQPQYKDCPGCAKCEKNGGLVLRKGSWRPTRAHEYLFEFAKKIPYFCDMEAVKEDSGNNTHSKGIKLDTPIESAGIGHVGWSKGTNELVNSRNLRDVWTINLQPWSRAHYATFPEKLIEPIIKVATSEKGVCPKCGSPWARIVDTKQIKRKRPEETAITKPSPDRRPSGNAVAGIETTTIGWRATCSCGCEETIPAIVYDPFMGSGTVAAVAAKLGRNYGGSELSTDYLENQANLRIQEAETGISMEELESGQQALFE